MNIPENHVVSEGRSLRSAIDAAAEQLGVPAAQVEHKIDIAHFRSSQGVGVGSDTVKIFAWAKAPVVVSPLQQEAENWMKELLNHMGIVAQVRSNVVGSSVAIQVEAGESGGHLVGKRGITLRAIQYLMGESFKGRYPDASFTLDVAGGPREERNFEDRGPREERAPRDDRREERGPRRDDRRDDRGPRRDDRRDDRGPRRDDRGGGDRRRREDEEELKKLARKLAQRVLATGEPEVIRRDLNSYDRRVVHLEVASVEGAASRSIGEGHERRVEIYAAGKPSQEGGEE